MSPAAVAALAGWRLQHPCLAGFATVEELLAGCGRDRSVPQEEADGRLALLVGEARVGDRAACRVVLERVMPGLVRVAIRRSWRSGVPFASMLDDLAASAWLVIAGYPLARRPTKIAVNILLDAEYRLFGYVPAAARATVLVPPEELPELWARLAGEPVDTAGHPGVEALGVLAEAVRGGLPPADGRLLAELIVCGRTPEEIAARDGVTSRAIRFRRRAAMNRLMEYTAAAFGPSPGQPDEISA